MPAVGAALVLTVLLLGIALLLGGRAAAAPQATIVRCDPATVAGPVGSTIDIDIYVQDVVDLWAGDVRVAFDESVLQVVDADPAATGVQIQPLNTFLSPDYVVRKGVYEEDGGQKIVWYAATQIRGSEPVSGSGPLARITFTAQQPGSFTLPITYHKLVRSNSLEIPSTAQGCSITFVDVDSGGVTFVPFTVRN
jgi:hypothetical protein